MVELLTSRRSDASDNNSSSASVGDGTGSVRADGVESDGRGEDSSGSDEASGKKRRKETRTRVRLGLEGIVQALKKDERLTGKA